MAKHAEGREKSERLVIPVTVEEHAFAKNAAGEAGFAGKAREVLRGAGLLPPLARMPTPDMRRRSCVSCRAVITLPASDPRTECFVCSPAPERAAKAKRGK